jgi:arsenate reductase
LHKVATKESVVAGKLKVVEGVGQVSDKIRVYEKPTCTKCREVKKLLQEKGVEFESINYFEESLTPEGLKTLLRAAGLKAEEAMRKSEPAYREFVAGKGLNDAELIRLMVQHPELIQRPIVVKGKKAVIARPAEKLSELDI